MSKKNFRKAFEYCNTCVSLGVQKVRFTNFLNQGKAKINLNDSIFLTDLDRIEFFEIIESARRRIPKEILNIERCGSFGKNPSKQNFYCGGGVNNIALAPDLKVYPCVFLIEPKYEIGFYEDGKSIFMMTSSIQMMIVSHLQISTNNTTPRILSKAFF